MRDDRVSFIQGLVMQEGFLQPCSGNPPVSLGPCPHLVQFSGNVGASSVFDRIICMQDTFARATHSAYAAGRPSAARDDRVSCIQQYYYHCICQPKFSFQFQFFTFDSGLSIQKVRRNKKLIFFEFPSVLNHSTLEFRDFSKRAPGN